MIRTGVYFQTNGLVNNSVTSKEQRIVALQPLMKMKKIHFPDDIDTDAMAELLYEMKGYIKTGATTAHDDGIDCLANFLDPDFIILPSGDKPEEYDGDFMDDFDEVKETYW